MNNEDQNARELTYPSVDDELEVRNCEGETECITPIVAIDGNIITTHYGKFRINGNKNISGDEVYKHVVGKDDYSVMHAVLVK